MGVIRNNRGYLPFLLSMALGSSILVYSVEEIVDSMQIDKVQEEETLDADFTQLSNVYYDYIDAIASEMKILVDSRDIVGDFALYETMLKNDFISYGCFEYSEVNFEYPELLGANIALGEGVCINEAQNMCDVFTSLGYEAKIVPGKYYKKGEVVANPNHAVVYVSDGKFAYLLDPTNDTILLRHSFGLYYSIESQEDEVYCFEPAYTFENNYYGRYDNLQLLGDFFDDHKKHWDVLRAYKNYKGAYGCYVDEMFTYEKEVLASYEEEINNYYEEKAKEYKRN